MPAEQLKLLHVATTVIFPVADLEETSSFYRSLGFDVESYDEGYAWVLNAGEEVFHLTLVEGLDKGSNHSAAYMNVADADRLHEAWSSVPGVSDLADREWGMREFSITDPSGNLLRVGHSLPSGG